MSALLQPAPQPEQKPNAMPRLVAPPPAGRSSLWWIAPLLVLGAAAAWWWNQPAETAAQVVLRTAVVEQGRLENRMRVTGVTAAREFDSITCPRLTGPEANRPMVLLKLSKNGSMVKKGDLIAEIDGQALQDHIDDVHATCLQAESDLGKRKAEQELDLATLQQNVRVAKAELDKAALELKAAEVRTAIDAELLKLAADEATARFQQLNKEAELKQQQQAAEIRILEYTLQRHIRHRDRHKSDLTRFKVYAKMDGLAVAQNVFRAGEYVSIGEGDTVMSGQLLMQVVNPRSMQMNGTINQAEAGNFRLGQPVDVRFDAFPELKTPGKVHSLGAIAVQGWRENKYIRTIPIQVTLDAYDQRIIPDLSASGDVLVAPAQNALLIPRAAVQRDGQSEFAMVEANGKVQRRVIRTGDSNLTHAVVAEGLRAGERVVIPEKLLAAN
jgi:HlyD family secretion protein